MSRSIPTSLGPVDCGDLAPILYHEHVVLDNRRIPSLDKYWLPEPTLMVPELDEYRRRGGRSVISLTNQCMGRDVEALRKISSQSGVAIVLATGLYTKPASPRVGDPRDLAKTFVRELNAGIGDTGVRAAVIGEIGTGAWPVGEFERGLFEAAALAHVETGVPIATHTHAGRFANWQLTTLTRLGVPAERVALGHLDEGLVNGAAYVEGLARLAATGAYLGFDTVGITYYSEFMKRQQPSDRERAVAIKRLVDLGFADRILISHDICRPDHLVSGGGWGYGHIFDVFMPLLEAEGVSRTISRRFIEDNPLRWLT